MPHAIWFRQDLRLLDNTALTQACQQSGSGVVALFVITPDTWKRHSMAAVRVDSILRQLRVMSAELAALNIPLKILNVPRYQDCVEAVTAFCQEHKVEQLHANRQPLLDEVARDHSVKQALEEQRVEFALYDDITVLPPTAVTKDNGEPLRVFTPYKKRWWQTVSPECWYCQPAPVKQPELDLRPDAVPSQVDGFESSVDSSLWPVGEQAVQQALTEFCQYNMMEYKDKRDFPSLDATSKMSVYLASGLISARQCVQACLHYSGVDSLSELAALKGPEHWLSEVIWREFYYAIAVQFPEVVRHEPFQPHTKALKWSTNIEHFQAWCEGKTGFPLVDAAMRQLVQTGWMHNRLRMVAAMFLTKTLFIDWRLGERFFMEQLVDGDFASNNGGWQWSASTGTDAAPYFRIFNPTSQSQKFDPKGEFIRQYCPELAGCPDKEIHNPPSTLRQQFNYPEPIVDYASMRKLVIAAFKELSR